MKLLTNNKHTWIIPLYAIFYIGSFIYLERRVTEPHIIHCVIDDYIPFCEYFIIPYVMWYFFVGITIMYFGFLCKNLDEYWHLTGALLSGMTVFLIVSFVYPNGQNLRPDLQEGNLFVQAVRILYWIDTPTNILPSLHVYNAVACCTAICTSQDLKNRRKLVLGTKFLTIMIVLSTMFIKQHSSVDVSMALILYAFCYQLFYKGIPQYRKKLSQRSARTDRMALNYYAEQRKTWNRF